ncbi:MAG: GNAT family N-acetyltransferase [Anaerolineaceae bacterium]|nr:GNAT family N-acetyltransferase [Anaerolineaceae bacterium]
MRLESERFVIRPVEEAREAPAILEVYRQCEDFLALGPVAVASPEMVQADLYLSQEEGCTFCGIYDRVTGEMMGIVDFSNSGFESDPTLAFLSLLMIAAPFRGHGLGEAVVQAVESEIRRVGRARAIESGVQVNNPGGVHFWQRMGYRIVSGPTLMPDGTTVYRLWKDL